MKNECCEEAVSCDEVMQIHVYMKVAWVITIRYDTRCYFNVRSIADIGLSQLNLPHGTDN